MTTVAVRGFVATLAGVLAVGWPCRRCRHTVALTLRLKPPFAARVRCLVCRAEDDLEL